MPQKRSEDAPQEQPPAQDTRPPPERDHHRTQVPPERDAPNWPLPKDEF